jgi:hypothetical protein
MSGWVNALCVLFAKCCIFSPRFKRGENCAKLPSSNRLAPYYHDLWRLNPPQFTSAVCFLRFSDDKYAIYWNFPWFGSRGRRCDPQVYACWWRPRHRGCQKLCLVLEQWVVPQNILFIDFSLFLPPNRWDSFSFFSIFLFLFSSARLKTSTAMPRR